MNVPLELTPDESTTGDVVMVPDDGVTVTATEPAFPFVAIVKLLDAVPTGTVDG